MKPAPDKHSASKRRPASAAGGEKSRRRPARKLFQIEAKPLDSTAPAAPPLRQLRRSRPWLPLLLLLPGLLCAADDSIDTNSAAHPPVPLGDFVGNGETELPPAHLDVDQEPIPASGTNMAAALAVAPVNQTSPPAAQRNPIPAEARSPERDNRSREQRNRDGEARSPERDNQQAQSRSPAPDATASSAPDFSAYRIISERNIFDPNRSPRRASNAQRPRPKTVDSFALVGIMTYEKGAFAFFDGTRGDFKRAVKESGEIAGFKVASVSPDAVRLASGEQQFDLKVGMQLRREEEGPWEPSSQTASYASGPGSRSSAASPAPAPSAPPAAPSTSGGSADDVLRRLMQRREQE